MFRLHIIEDVEGMPERRKVIIGRQCVEVKVTNSSKLTSFDIPLDQVAAFSVLRDLAEEAIYTCYVLNVDPEGLRTILAGGAPTVDALTVADILGNTEYLRGCANILTKRITGLCA